MPIYNLEEVKGVERSGGKVVCMDCWQNDFEKGDRAIDANELEHCDHLLYVCDECGKKL